MAEIVTKEQYWIDILNDNSKFGQITTEDTSFNLRANDVWRVIENSLLVTEDEEDVANWEGITQLSGEGLTIFQRKVNILYVLSTKSYVPISLVEEIASKTSGKDVEIFYDKEQGKLVVHTDRAEEDTVEITNSIINKVLPESVEIERYNHNLEVSWEDKNKYSLCTTMADFKAINENYTTDVTTDGEWEYDLNSLIQGSSLFKSAKSIKKFNGKLPELTDANNIFQQSGVVEFNSELPKLTNGYAMFQGCQLKHWTIDMPELTAGGEMFNGCGALKTFTGALPKLQGGASMFVVCKGLTEWTVELPSLTNGSQLFNSCSNLQIFKSPLVKMTNA